MKVKVTQFYTPHGEQRVHEVEVPDDCAVGYEALTAKGCRLTAEVLLTGHVSQCIEHEEGDFDQKIHVNDPTNRKSEDILADMIRRFDGAKFDEWLTAIAA